MKENSSAENRITKIISLVDEYFLLDKGDLIDNHVELLRIADIPNNASLKHPHALCRVYISRRARKHFVEERKEAFFIKHSEVETLDAIHFAIRMISDVLSDFDYLEYEPKTIPSKYFYSKDYRDIGRPAVRILVEEKEKTLQIRSIHFQTRDDDRQK
ncbi:MAG: hypothetical protein JWM39_610 [Parcubacteria group bacterium]|nr:hypothetical protein [Parcubacteria group bacterium]